VASGKDQPFLPGLGPERRGRRVTGLLEHKFFLAVKPDAAVVGRIGDAASCLVRENQLTGNPLKLENFHISLPLIWKDADFPADLAEIVSAQVQAVRMSPFEIVLDMAMSFPQPGRHVLVLGIMRSIANIYDLNRKLVFAMGSKAGRPSFTPHMTVFYADRPIEKQPVKPIGWTVREFVLIHSFVGLGRHEIVGRWPLR